MRWFYEAQILQSQIGQDAKRGNSLILRGVPPPLPQKLIQLFIDRRFTHGARDSQWLWTCRLRHARPTTASLPLIRLDFQPVWPGDANIAVAAGFPFGSFAEVAADVALPALRGLHETLDFMVALPGALLLGRVFDLADKKPVQARILSFPEQKAISRQRVSTGAARFLVILLDTLRQREMNHRAHSRFVDAQAEGHGADHDAHFIRHPFFLVLPPRGAFHLAVIAHGRDSVFLQKISRFSPPP